MKQLVIITEEKQLKLDKLLGNGVTVTEISRLLGMAPDTLREKLKRRARGDSNWHNRAGVDNRGAYAKARAAALNQRHNEVDDERDDIRIRLFDLTKSADGVTVQQAMRMTGYSEMDCRKELDDFCRRPTRSDVEAICKKVDGRYCAIGWQGKINNAGYSGIKIIEVIRGRR